MPPRSTQGTRITAITGQGESGRSLLRLFAAPLVPVQQMLRGAGENTDLRIIAGTSPGMVHGSCGYPGAQAKGCG